MIKKRGFIQSVRADETFDSATSHLANPAIDAGQVIVIAIRLGRQNIIAKSLVMSLSKPLLTC
jgi:hypothetical protein